MQEINLATLNKQDEILTAMEDDGVTLIYLLAKSDSLARESDIKALKGMTHMRNITGSQAALNAVINSTAAMTLVVESSNALDMLINSGMGMSALLVSKVALDVIEKSSQAFSKVIAKLSGLYAASFKDMEAIVSSSTAMSAVIDSPAMKIIANSTNATRLIFSTPVSIEAVSNSYSALIEFKNSRNTKIATETGDMGITGEFVPIVANKDGALRQAYNGSWSNIDSELGGWIKRNKNNPIATKIKSKYDDDIVYYYDLEA